MLTSTTIEIIDQYWSSFLGCRREALYERHTLVVSHAGLSDYHGILVFLRHALLVVSVPHNLLDVLRPQAEGWSQTDVLQKDWLWKTIGYPVECVVGPAFVGYTDDAAFRPVQAEGLRLLEPQDVAALAALQAACSTLEWEHGGCQLSVQPVVGIYVEEHLVAVAGYELWGDIIAHIAVITHPHYRGQGYGRAVVSRLTEEVLCQGLVPQYRTLEANGAAMAIARMLGFERYATTVAVRFRPDSIYPYLRAR